MANRLTLVPGESSTHGLHYWEPLVDERPLRHIVDELFRQAGLGWRVDDNVPVLVHSWPLGLPDDARALLGEQPPRLANGHVPLFVCPECGDADCGAVTVTVTKTADTVVWQDFAWYAHYTSENSDRIAVGSLTFDRLHYEAELHRFIATFDQVRAALQTASLPAPTEDPTRRQPRRWVWPFS